MKINPRLWQASPSELKKGYYYDSAEELFVCLVCDKRFREGIIYEESGTFYDAERFLRKHIEATHGSMFDYLANLDKRYTGLSEQQSNILSLFHSGESDAEIAEELGLSNTSTVRNHRFNLREKHRQAKIIIALSELIEEKKIKRELI